MIKLEYTDVYGFEVAIRGMRNPMNSWNKSDSYWTYIEDNETLQRAKFEFFIGEADLKLMKSLSKAGNDHSKYLRYIDVTVDITAPLYWWKEFDTYKVGTVSNSCSTMHKIHAKEFELDDFSFDHIENEYIDYYNPKTLITKIVECLNECRENFLWSKDKKYWWQMIQLLPSSYNQRRTIKLNYQVLKNMYHARKNHKLDEWREFCKWCESLPYFKEICIDE